MPHLKISSADRKPDDLRDRLIDRRRDGESHHERERHKRERREGQQLDQRHQQLEQQRHQLALQEQTLPPPVKETPQERAEREERESRRLKLIEAGRNPDVGLNCSPAVSLLSPACLQSL